MQLSGVFWKIYNAAERSPRIISQRGGTRSGKTFSTLQFLWLLIPRADKAGDVTSVVSESLPHLKRGAIRDFESIVGKPLKMCEEWNQTELTWTFPNGAKLEFFSVDNPGKVQGPARKRLFENECNHISYEAHRQLAVRTTGLIILDYNPSAVFWAIEKVEPREDCICIKTTYLDNREFLSAEQIAEIESNKEDVSWWKVYGLGEIGTLEGVIYDFDTIDEMPGNAGLLEVQGLDFGFSNSFTARVRLLVDIGRKIIYAQERCYRRGMLNSDIVADLRADGVPAYVPIYADCAEPKSIEEISRGGFRVLPCVKSGEDKKVEQIQWLKGWKLLFTKDSLNLINEARTYTWLCDKDGNYLNYPIKKNDHLMDAMRYAAWTGVGVESGKGQYNLTLAR